MVSAKRRMTAVFVTGAITFSGIGFAAPAIAAPPQVATVILVAEGKFSGGKVVAKGTAEVGKTLTAKVSGFTPTPSSYKYQWLRDGNKIPGATKGSYTLQKADAGHAIKVKVTALRSGKIGKTIKSDPKTVKSEVKRSNTLAEIIGNPPPGKVVGFQAEGNGGGGWHINSDGAFVNYFGYIYTTGNFSQVRKASDGSYLLTIANSKCLDDIKQNQKYEKCATSSQWLKDGQTVRLLPTKGKLAYNDDDYYWFCGTLSSYGFCRNGYWTEWTLVAPDGTINRNSGGAFESAWKDEPK